MIGIPARPTLVDAADYGRGFVPYGTPCSGMFDPETQKLEILKCEVDFLRKRVEELIAERERPASGEREIGGRDRA
jgi:serine O-acetyltransferase